MADYLEVNANQRLAETEAFRKLLAKARAIVLSASPEADSMIVVTNVAAMDLEEKRSENSPGAVDIKFEVYTTVQPGTVNIFSIKLDHEDMNRPLTIDEMIQIGTTELRRVRGDLPAAPVTQAGDASRG